MSDQSNVNKRCCVQCDNGGAGSLDDQTQGQYDIAEEYGVSDLPLLLPDVDDDEFASKTTV